MKPTIKAMIATPPTTPPAMVPVWLELEFGCFPDDVEFDTAGEPVFAVILFAK